LSALAVIAIPIALSVIGIVLNSFHIVHDQPQYSLEADPIHKLAAERHANYRFFQLQRARILQRQKTVGRYSWLVLIAFIASAWFLYSDTVKTTTVSKQISAIQTFANDDGPDAVLAVTLADGSGVQYLLKAAEVRRVNAATTAALPKQTIENWQPASLKTVVNIGDVKVPLGIALKIE
jgi:hypothetical protein